MITEILEKESFVNIPEYKLVKGKLAYWNDGENVIEREFDLKGRKISEKTNNSEKRWKYTIEGRVSYLYDNGYEQRKKYNKRGEITKIYDNQGVVNILKYNRRGQPIYVMEQGPDGVAFETKFEYDRKGNITSKESSSGLWEKRSYDKKSNCIAYSNSLGENTVAEYDKKGRLTKEETNGTVTKKNTYEKNKLVYSFDKTIHTFIENDLQLEIVDGEEKQYRLNGFLLKTTLDSNE